ncbi:unnamed protein product [Mytilus coruscus]|uniref:Uncharacterized protein n=1 Tax=Mytilus coruscus TaxID=42192 RepID=A0A6J8ARE0_MYTCO|nr:unnamed protein product [Mytilus coruscus]
MIHEKCETFNEKSICGTNIFKGDILGYSTRRQAGYFSRLAMKFVIFLCMLRSGFARGFFFLKYGELDQSDPYLFVGEYFNITCTLSSQSVENGDNSSKLFFSYGNDIEVQAAETTIINNASLKHSTLITTAFRRPYYCNLRNPVFIKTDPLKNIALLDSTIVDTESDYLD